MRLPRQVEELIVEIMTRDEDTFLPQRCENFMAGLENAGYVFVPKELTPAIACALKMCSPPEAQSPEAVAQLVKDYTTVWWRVVAVANQ